MRHFVIGTFFFACLFCFGQNATAVSPSQGYRGSVLPITISGNNFCWDIATGYVDFYHQASGGAYAFYTAILPWNTDSNSIEVTAYIDTSVPTGLYDVQIIAWEAGTPSGCSPYTVVLPGAFEVVEPGVIGSVFLEYDSNCNRDSLDPDLAGFNVLIEPIGVVAQTYSNGAWWVDSLPPGNYQAVINPPPQLQASCPLPQPFTVVASGTATVLPPVAFVPSYQCPLIDVEVQGMGFVPCMNNGHVYVYVGNSSLATDVFYGSYVDVTLDSNLTIWYCNFPYTALGNNVFRVNIGDLYPGHHAFIEFMCSVSCNTVIDQTLCNSAQVFPNVPCVLDTQPTIPLPAGLVTPNILPQPCISGWDQSSLSISSWCDGDSVRFTIINNGLMGSGDMQCYSPVLIYNNDVLVDYDTIMLLGQQTKSYAYYGTGETWLMRTEQHPLHPGDSHPRAHIERCGATLSNWIPDMINNQPQDDNDPIIDISCDVVVASFDPNDKTGYPVGVTSQHHILPNQEMEYRIRFQNTGTDTAHTVVIRDTLDINLDILSVTSGVSSHDYDFFIHGPRVLEWRFQNIKLPDSTTNEPESHGFVRFKVKQMPNLPHGTVIYNDADIYFDFNPPVITNETDHMVNTYGGQASIQEAFNIDNNKVRVYPNPNHGQINVIFEEIHNVTPYVVTDLNGRTILKGVFDHFHNVINLYHVKSGLYFLSIDEDTTFKIIKE